MPSVARRRPKAERVREILIAARSVFAEHGYQAAPISEIARRAGVVEGTIYKHFENKRDLLFRVMSEFYAGLIADVEAGLRSIRGTANRLRFVIGRHVHAFSADRGLCRLLIREIRPDGDLYDASMEELNRRYTRAAARILEEGIAAGEIRRDVDSTIARHMIYGAIEHVVWRFVFHGGRLDVDRLADDLTRTLLTGLLAAPSRGGAVADSAVERLEAHRRPRAQARPGAVGEASLGMKTVLVANRGEIAVRILRTLRAMGVRGVVVYHAADASSLAVREADEAHEIAGGSGVAAYLDAEAILGAARASGADAVHPGYGFLAENAAFAEAVEQAGLLFIGPPPDVIRLLGDKIRARELVARAGFPVTPSATDPGDLPRFIAAAREVGFPLLIKAAAGGGGRGMRIVREPEALAEEIAAARREAERSFKDGRVYAERYIERPRHIEVQILSDAHGNHLHLGERECSVQRRFQKIIEETPSAALTADQRRRLCETAIGIARAVGYRNAGTVEFIFAPTGEFYFLEVNTRLQVEHPVTEMVTGLDLVAEQIRVADGQPLSFRQEQVGSLGHSIECRICAEDPSSGHAPTTGEVALLRAPSGPGVRFDSGLCEGQRITTAFDSMLAKLIVHGADRAQAIARMRQGLRDLVLLGVSHNAAFLERVLAHPAFAAGELHTHFLEQHADGLSLPSAAGPDGLAVLAAAALAAPPTGGEIPEPYASIGSWRN